MSALTEYSATPDARNAFVEYFTLATLIDRMYCVLCITRGDRVEIDAGRVTVWRTK